MSEGFLNICNTSSVTQLGEELYNVKLLSWERNCTMLSVRGTKDIKVNADL
jgi:hypothetical protein